MPFIPEEAVVSFAGIVKVYVIAGGKAEERKITTGQRRDEWVEILSEIGEGPHGPRVASRTASPSRNAFASFRCPVHLRSHATE